MEKNGLVLEGGGMRGIYTTGVLDYFIEKNIEFDNCYGVSAGACHACSYLSKQKGRGFKVCTDYLKDKRYMSLRSLVSTGDMFGVKMLYEIIPNELNLYDYETFNDYKGDFYAVVTNCRTGEPEYIPIKDMRKDIVYIRASSSLPLLARKVRVKTKKYLDGGIVDSIPVKKAIDDGNKKVVAILTRDENYRKTPNGFMSIIKRKYKDYPKLIEKIENRHIMYNDSLDYVKEAEKNGSVFIIRPKEPVKIGRLEKNKERLTMLYKQGYQDAKDCYDEMIKFLQR